MKIAIILVLLAFVSPLLADWEADRYGCESKKAIILKLWNSQASLSGLAVGPYKFSFGNHLTSSTVYNVLPSPGITSVTTVGKRDILLRYAGVGQSSTVVGGQGFGILNVTVEELACYRSNGNGNAGCALDGGVGSNSPFVCGGNGGGGTSTFVSVIFKKTLQTIAPFQIKTTVLPYTANFQFADDNTIVTWNESVDPLHSACLFGLVPPPPPPPCTTCPQLPNLCSFYVFSQP